MNDTSAEVRQTCEARSMSAASRAAVYFAICCWIASFAAWESAALAPGAAHDKVKTIAKHKPNGGRPAALALFGFLILYVPLDAELIGYDAKAGCPECFLKGHANGSVFRERIKQ